MARDESDREDLLREATALVERIELLIGPQNSPAGRAVAGFRAEGAFSVFFDDDPVYQFNVAGELRRAFVEGLLFKAVGGRLASLKRVRQSDRVELQRHDLSDEERFAFLAHMADRLQQLDATLNAGDYQIIGQVPPAAEVVGRIKCWLADHRDWPVAATPRV